MQYTGMTEMFGFIGEMFSKAFKPLANKFEHKVHSRGDAVVHFWTKSNRPLKILGFMSGSFVVVAGGVVINRKIKNNEIMPASPLANTYFNNEYNATILPRLQQAMQTAFKYGENGNISLLDPHLDTIAEIVIQYPQFKQFVKYTKPMEFPINTYFDGKNCGFIVQNEQIENMESDESEPIMLQSQTESADTATMILSMNEKELKDALLKNREKNSVIKFENQLDFIRHLCVIKRCEKIYFRAVRHGKKGNVEETAGILSELWEYVCEYEVGPIIICSPEGKKCKLEEDDLFSVMRLCHRNYTQYLIDCAKHIGDKVDRKGLRNEMIGDVNKRLLNMVLKNLENARIYAEKYNVLGDDVKYELKTVWQEKESQFAN